MSNLAHDPAGRSAGCQTGAIESGMADAPPALVERCPACLGTGRDLVRASCEGCDGAGELTPACDAAPWVVALASDHASRRCDEPAVGRCRPCDEPLCERHLAWHRAECGEETTP